jgi:hypothetical protein
VSSTFKGLVYIKHVAVGSRSEGPGYFLQTKDRDYPLVLEKRPPWKPDRQLEPFCRKMVEIEGELLEEGGASQIQVSSIKETDDANIP